MERRMDKYRQISPERAKVWTERSPKYVQYRKVSVLYYLSRNQQLEHPHFVEVKLSSSDGLYLRDFIKRLNELRGRGIASRYSWSCKRSYKTGFVWHDLSEDDLIRPASGSEYVLKGSELIEEPNSERIVHSKNMKYQNPKRLLGPTSGKSRDDSSTSSSMNGKERTPSLEDAYSPRQHPGSCSVSPVYRARKIASPVANLSLVEYKVGNAEKAANASTQTEENHISELSQETCTRGVSTEEGLSTPVLSPARQNQNTRVRENCVMPRTSGSPSSCQSESSSAGKTDTLESLIKADARKMNSFQILEEEDNNMSSNIRSKATNMIMQLISCGTISVKDHGLGLISTYKPRFSSSKFSSPLYSSSVLLGEMDYLYENPRKMGFKLEDKEYFSGSLIETKMLKGLGGLAALKRSSSFDADRTSKLSIEDEEKDEVASSTASKCIPLSIKASLSRHPRSESMRSPTSDRPRISSEIDISQTSTPSVSVGNSKRVMDTAVKKSPKSSFSGSFREDSKVTKIEERLASGARVIIQSTLTSDLS